MASIFGVPAFYIMKDLILKIKSKKPLDRLDDEFVEIFVNDFFNKNSKIKKKYLEGEIKKKEFEIIFKNVRNELNKIYAQFWLSDKMDLSSHKSTKERINFLTSSAAGPMYLYGVVSFGLSCNVFSSASW